MRMTWLVALALLGWTAPLSAGEAASPYAGQESRDIKSLSAEEVRAYLGGEGLGFAKAAELNHYPGPKHVLELADRLELTEIQRGGTQAIFDAMKADATRLGRRYVQLEARLDSLFAQGSISRAELERHVQELASIQGKIRIAHLKAHLSQRDLLTAAQTRTYDMLRGYGTPEGSRHDGHKH